MSLRTIRRRPVGDAAPEPATPPSFLAEAVRAVRAGFPRRPITVAPGVDVGAVFVVDAFRDVVDAEIEPQSVSADVAERIRAYTGGGE